MRGSLLTWTLLLVVGIVLTVIIATMIGDFISDLFTRVNDALGATY